MVVGREGGNERKSQKRPVRTTSERFFTSLYLTFLVDVGLVGQGYGLQLLPVPRTVSCGMVPGGYVFPHKEERVPESAGALHASDLAQNSAFSLLVDKKQARWVDGLSLLPLSDMLRSTAPFYTT